MFGTMAKKKEEPAPRGRTGKPLNVWISEELREALDRFVEQERRTITTVVEMILEKHLTEQGLWPPK